MLEGQIRFDLQGKVDAWVIREVQKARSDSESVRGDRELPTGIRTDESSHGCGAYKVYPLA